MEHAEYRACGKNHEHAKLESEHSNRSESRKGKAGKFAEATAGIGIANRGAPNIFTCRKNDVKCEPRR